MRSKRAVRFFNDELAKATVAATVATSLVDRKRKAADAAGEDFKTTSRMTRHCSGTGQSPSNYSVSPVYSDVVLAAADAEETQLPCAAEPPIAAPLPSAAPIAAKLPAVRRRAADRRQAAERRPGRGD